jgi:hypothetical protein
MTTPAAVRPPRGNPPPLARSIASGEAEAVALETIGP